jgi:hypothetical protein
MQNSFALMKWLLPSHAPSKIPKSKVANRRIAAKSCDTWALKRGLILPDLSVS